MDNFSEGFRTVRIEVGRLHDSVAEVLVGFHKLADGTVGPVSALDVAFWSFAFSYGHLFGLYHKWAREESGHK